MPKLVPIGNAPLIGALAGASTAAGGIYAQQRERELLDREESERTNLAAFNSQLRMQEDDYRTGNDLGLRRSIEADEQRQNDAAKAERATAWGLFSDKLKANADADEHGFIDLAGSQFVNTGKPPAELLQYFSIKPKDAEKIKQEYAKIEAKRVNDERNAELRGRGIGIQQQNADTNYFRAITGSEQGDRRLSETERANQAREGQAARNADALAGDRANRGGMKKTAAEQLEEEEAEDIYKLALSRAAEAARQIDGNKSDTVDRARLAQGRADMMLNNLNNVRGRIRERLNGQAQPVAAPAPSAPPAAMQPPSGGVYQPSALPPAGLDVRPGSTAPPADPRAIRDALAQQLGRPPTLDELTEALKLAGLGD